MINWTNELRMDLEKPISNDYTNPMMTLLSTTLSKFDNLTGRNEELPANTLLPRQIWLYYKRSSSVSLVLRKIVNKRYNKNQ